ncbi:MAG: hypothetical protein LBV60_17535 [Streptomyces sp.]|jgi:hypothetical protein|nr:hypothetical protein [Streptomyces sp.]
MRLKRLGRVRLAALCAAGVLAMSPAFAAASTATPVPDGGSTVVPSFIGHAARAKRLPPHKPPQNPFMAPNPFNNVHNDSWISDTYAIAGPRGHRPAVRSSTSPTQGGSSPLSLCASINFDRHGRLEMVCGGPGRNGGPVRIRLLLLDPESLAILASFDLPSPSSSSLLAGLGSAYFYLDDRDRAVVSTADNHLLLIAQTGRKHHPGFRLVKDYDLSSQVGTDHLAAVLPDWSGRLWFATDHSGIIGVLDRSTGSIRTLKLNEENGNGLAMTRTGVYIVTVKAQYRIFARKGGAPRIEWSAPYQNIGTTKPGQVTPGSGTTPTILGGGKYVAIADNADQMHVVVYRTAVHLPRGKRRTVCEVPVFPQGTGGTDNSLMGSGRSLLVVNGFGYALDENTLKVTPSVPGAARVDIARDGSGCRLVWNNRNIVVPSVLSKMSTRTGLVYTYTLKKDPASGVDVWYWSALDFRKGRVVWEKRAGTGSLFNNHYAPLSVGPNHNMYLGVLGGIAAIKDTRGHCRTSRCP